MADEDPIVEIAKRLPIKQAYEDAVHPAAKQTGGIGEDLMKTLRLALAPLQYGAALQDRFARHIDNSVRRIPEERRVAPAPQILGPVLEGIRYEPEGTPIDELFSALLSTAMDSERLDRAHPAFPKIIAQLSRDEATILKELRLSQFGGWAFYVPEQGEARGRNHHHIKRKAGPPFRLKIDELSFPDRFPFYFAHLYHLGLTEVTDYRDTERVTNIEGKGLRTEYFQEFRLQPLGQALVEACIRDEQDTGKSDDDAN